MRIDRMLKMFADLSADLLEARVARERLQDKLAERDDTIRQIRSTLIHGGIEVVR